MRSHFSFSVGFALLAFAILPLLSAATSTPSVGEPEDALLARIRESYSRRGHRGGGNLFDQLASLKTADSLEAMQKAVRAPHRHESLDRAFRAFEHYRGLDELEPEAIEFLLEETESSTAWYARAAALGLAQFELNARRELEHVAARRADPVVRARALRPLLPILAADGNPDALELILRAAMPDHSGTHESLRKALDPFTGDDCLSVFGKGLADEHNSPAARVCAVESLASRAAGKLEVDQALVCALKAKHGTVVIAALEALEARESTLHARQLSKLIKSKEGAVRRRAIIALGRVSGGEKGWSRKLERLSGSSDAATRQGAAAALAQLRTQAAIELLYTELIGDRDQSVRAEVLQQIGNLRRKDSIPILIARINAEGGRLRIDVLTVLRLVTGEDYGTTYERWKRWWDAAGEAFEVPPYEDALDAERDRRRSKGGGQTVTGFYGLEIVSDRVAFVLDVSGSMREGGRGGRGGGGGGRSKIDAAKEELQKFLGDYPEGALFNLIFFASDVFPWQDELVSMTDKSREAALKYVARQGADGATAVYDGLQQAFEDPRVDTIVLLTDGRPEMGTTDDPVQIREDVRLWNAARHIRIHCLSIRRDSDLLKGLAEDSGGDYRQVR